jgi:predicted ATPase
VRGASIRTPDQRLRVFVSSTLAELAEERAAVREAIELLQLTPVLFELGARPHPPRDLYRAYLEQSQIFVGIYWQRYGWVAPAETVSGLEDEYGLSEGMPRLLYVKAPAPDREVRLSELLGRIQSDDTASYKPFQTPEELARLVSADLALLLSERFMSLTTASDDHLSPTTDRPHHNLPVQLSSLVGREAEMATVKAALAQSRLVTLTGVGGAGKSRLALQAAGDLLNEYADGAWLVELAPLSEPERVPSAVASGLAIAEDPHLPPARTLEEQLRSRQLLLVVDNCEHVLATCADLLASLLSAAPDLRVLATSREALGVPGEIVIPVTSLAVPGEATDVSLLPSFSAVQLFIERARAVRPDFELTQANAEAVAEIVRRLDGIPLALELAAARVKVLSPEQIAGRLSDRFRILAGGPRTVLPRQQTLRAAMDWSYGLLDDMEQHVLRRLSVFMGSSTLEAIEAICGRDDIEAVDVLDVVSRLVDKSLVVVIQGPENRYRLLETVRQYGRERLEEAGETEATRAAHRDWCSSMVEAAADQIRGGRQQARWLELLELQHDDLHTALEWSWSRGEATSLEIAVNAAWFWYLHGHWDEARRSLERTIAVAGAEPALNARGSAWAGVFAWRRGDLNQGSEYAQGSLRVLTDTGDEGEGLSLLVHTLVAISSQDYAAAEETGRRALQVFRAQNHRWGVTTSLLVLARIANNRRSGTLQQLLQESAPLVTSGNDLWGRAHILTLQGYEASRALDLDLARQLHSTAHDLAAELGDRAAQAENLLALGHIHLMLEQNDDAAHVLTEARTLVEQLHDPHDLGHVDEGLALLAVSRGDVEAGRALLDDVSRRFLNLDKAAMGTAYALGIADIYRRSGRPVLTAELLRHALSLLDETTDPEKHAQVRNQLTAVEDALLEEAGPRS